MFIGREFADSVLFTMNSSTLANRFEFILPYYNIHMSDVLYIEGGFGHLDRSSSPCWENIIF